MDDLLEALFEILIEIIFDGASDTAKSRRVPMPLRILCAVVLVIFVLAAVGLIVFCGVLLIRQHNIIAGVVILAVAAVMVGGLAFKFIKTYQDHQN